MSGNYEGSGKSYSSIAGIEREREREREGKKNILEHR
jgi:hypothetical protein